MIAAHLVQFVQIVQTARLVFLALAEVVTPAAISVQDIVQVVPIAITVMDALEAVLAVIINAIFVIMNVIQIIRPNLYIVPRHQHDNYHSYQ